MDPYTADEVAEIEAELPDALRRELLGEVWPHERGKRLTWLYGRLSYLHEICGLWDVALTIQEEGEAALALIDLKPPYAWKEARERIARKRTTHSGSGSL